MADAPSDRDAERHVIEVAFSDRKDAEIAYEFIEELLASVESDAGLSLHRGPDARDATIRAQGEEIARLRARQQAGEEVIEAGRKISERIQSMRRMLREVPHEHERDLIKALARLDAAPGDTAWRPDRPGWYWIRYEKSLSREWMGRRQWVVLADRTGFWADEAIRRGEPFVIGPYIPAPPASGGEHE